ncbi:conjugal transfer protein TrbL family protein [Sinanaerobacter sp. ZZT-01]|uniref:conjugal transfer protein TrbL family protein n=1 Tax=Sinanaerobacter sp. ZZT-01 TaxID=3111540 RepID=UPI002D78BA67|nr:conjugal transfer protein TrbL family protein [Sinanaerobacter sp. ZZT-01]WRR93385.1 conjugal transfer protein TrbL family protein [Sinanaerobacter sp. ZZT-01]
MNIGEVVKGIFAFLFEDAVTQLLQPFLELLEMVALSPETLSQMPWIESMYPVMTAIGMALCLLIIMWQALKSMFLGLGVEADEPTHIALKSFIAMFIVYYIKDILLLCVEVCSSFMSMILKSFTDVSDGLALYELLTVIMSCNIIYIVLVLFLIFKCIGLFYRMFKRLVLCGFLILCSPLAAACMVSRPTSGFWHGFVKLMAGNIAIQLLQAICFVIMQLSIQTVKVTVTVGANGPAGHATGVFGIMLTIAVVSIANNLEDIIRDMSFGIGVGRDMQGALGKLQSTAMLGSYASSMFRR